MKIQLALNYSFCVLIGIKCVGFLKLKIMYSRILFWRS